MQSDLKDLLVCGAFAGETDLLAGRELNILDTGVGNVDAAIKLMSFLSDNPAIKGVLFAGSAGFYQDSFAAGELVYSGTFVHHHPAAVKKLVRIPDIMNTFVETDPPGKLRGHLFQMKKGITNSFSGITVFDPDKEELEIINADFENMETFGLASVCKARNMDFAAIYCLTNRVGKSGSSDWQKNWRSCSDKLQNFLISSLWENKGT